MWAARNAMAALVAVLLAGVLGRAQVFREARLGSTGISASEIVHLCGLAVALGLLWVSAWRAAAQIGQLGESTPGSRLARGSLLPLAALLILPAIHGLLGPFVTGRLGVAVNWIFVLALAGTAVWFGLVVYENAEALILVVATMAHRLAAATGHAVHTCRACGAGNGETAKFCTSCGSVLGAETTGDERAPSTVAGAGRASTGATRSA